VPFLPCRGVKTSFIHWVKQHSLFYDPYCTLNLSGVHLSARPEGLDVERNRVRGERAISGEVSVDSFEENWLTRGMAFGGIPSMLAAHATVPSKS